MPPKPDKRRWELDNVCGFFFFFTKSAVAYRANVMRDKSLRYVLFCIQISAASLILV